MERQQKNKSTKQPHFRMNDCLAAFSISSSKFYSLALFREAALFKSNVEQRGSSTIIASCCWHLTKRAVAICTCSLIMRPFGAIMEQTRGPIFLSFARSRRLAHPVLFSHFRHCRCFTMRQMPAPRFPSLRTYFT